MDRNGLAITPAAATELLSGPVRAWFEATFPEGATPAQALAWPLIFAGENVLLIAATGTGKTLAAFLAVIDQLLIAGGAEAKRAGVRCVYISPLRSLNYDIERNLQGPLEGIWGRIGGGRECPVRVGVRTGDTPASERRQLRENPPQILITTPESLSLLLSQASWRRLFSGVDHLIVDEVHALARNQAGR